MATRETRDALENKIHDFANKICATFIHGPHSVRKIEKATKGLEDLLERLRKKEDPILSMNILEYRLDDKKGHYVSFEQEMKMYISIGNKRLGN